MKFFLVLVAFIHTCLTSSGQVNLDSLDRANAKAVSQSGDDIQKAMILKSDSAILIIANVKLDHRIFGFEKPDLSSKRLILFSIFTNDVEGNPFNCGFGAFYETGNLKEQQLKYLSRSGGFIKAKLIDENTSRIISYIYFEKKWVSFEK